MIVLVDANWITRPDSVNYQLVTLAIHTTKQRCDAFLAGNSYDMPGFLVLLAGNIRSSRFVGLEEREGFCL